MSMTGLSAFDHTVQKSNVWVNDLAQNLEWDDKHKAFQGMRMTLHALRDRLPVEEAAHLGAQLPVLLAGFYYEDWRPANKPTKERSKEEFLARIRDYLQNTDPDVDVEKLVRTVFEQLAMRISTGEIEDVTSMMPSELKELWPGSVRA